MKYLGIDYGEKRVGLAIGEADSELILPAGLKERHDDPSLVEDIAEVVELEGIDIVVVGEPLGLSGAATAQTQAVRNFANMLRARLAIPVDFVDERFTSKYADAVIQLGTHSRDEVAAMNILESYLSRQR